MLREEAKMYCEERDKGMGATIKRQIQSRFHLCKSYAVSIFRVYRAYWRGLLPYRTEIRPMAVCCSGENYIEDLIKGPVNPKIEKDAVTVKRRIHWGYMEDPETEEYDQDEITKSWICNQCCLFI